MNIESQYEYKYLKYKNKYLELKKIYDELNGGNPEIRCSYPLPYSSLSIIGDDVVFYMNTKDKPNPKLAHNMLKIVLCSKSKLEATPDNTLVNESNIKITKITKKGQGDYGTDLIIYEIIFPKEFKIRTELGIDKYTGKETEVCNKRGECRYEKISEMSWEYRKGKDDTWKKTDINNKKITFEQGFNGSFGTCKINDV